MMRSRVLALFRSLHRTRQSIFQGDRETLSAARLRINEEFRMNKDVADPEEIKQLLKIGEDVKLLMKKTIVQAKLNEKGRYKVRITEDTLREDNIPFLRGRVPSEPKGSSTSSDGR